MKTDTMMGADVCASCSVVSTLVLAMACVCLTAGCSHAPNVEHHDLEQSVGVASEEESNSQMADAKATEDNSDLGLTLVPEADAELHFSQSLPAGILAESINNKDSQAPPETILDVESLPDAGPGYTEVEIRDSTAELVQLMEGKSTDEPQPAIEGFVWIKPGMFFMGSPESEPHRQDDETLHQVWLTQGFYLAKYEVTQAEYEKVMGTNPSHFKGGFLNRKSRHPVEMVPWHDAIEFCNRLSERDGLEPHYEKAGKKVTILGGEGYRLPTEAEWEYACRAGSRTAYCFGDEGSQLGEYAWFDDNADNETHPVGRKKPNAWGIYDMHGNVWEWCWDGMDWYPEQHVNPVGRADSSARLARGGNWSTHVSSCRSAIRNSEHVDNVSSIGGVGFRIARNVASQNQPKLAD